MKCPSDAQASVLALVVEHADEGRLLMWAVEQGGTGRARFAYEEIDRQTDQAQWVSWSDYERRYVSVRACVRHGWLDDLHQRDWTYPHGRVTVRYAELRLTEDGEIALGLWRHRKLTAPPAPLPTLTPEDREVLRVAFEADRLGFALVPAYRTFGPEAEARVKVLRSTTRRLRRAGWVEQVYAGSKWSAIVPSALGAVEVDPDPDRLAVRGEAAPDA